MIDGTCTTTPQPLPSHRSARSSPSGRQASAPSSTFHPSSRRQEVVPRRHFHHRRCSNVSDEAQPSETSAEENCASDQGELRAEVVELPDLAPIHSPEGDEDGMSFSRTPHRHWINRRELTSQSELEPRQSLNPRKSTLLLPRSSLVSFRARSSPHRRKSSMVHFGSTQEESSTVLSKLAPGRSPILRRQSQRTSPLGAVLPPHPRPDSPRPKHFVRHKMGAASIVHEVKHAEYDDDCDDEDIADESDTFVTAPNTPRAFSTGRAPPSPSSIPVSVTPVKQVAQVARGAPCEVASRSQRPVLCQM
jgi:hypothetical protein